MKRTITDLLTENRIAIVGPVMVELIQGCRDEREKEKLEQALQGLRRLPISETDWDQAAQLAFTLRRRGVTVSAMDALIATAAMSHRCSLLHQDQDFERIRHQCPELKLYPT